MEEEIETITNPIFSKEVMESFGWVLSSSDESCNVIYQRDVGISHYYDLLSLEDYYTKIYNEPINPPKKLSKKWLIILLVLGILPGLLYLTSKSTKKRKYEMALEAKNDKLEALLVLARKYRSLR